MNASSIGAPIRIQIALHLFTYINLDICSRWNVSFPHYSDLSYRTNTLIYLSTLLTTTGVDNKLIYTHFSFFQPHFLSVTVPLSHT